MIRTILVDASEIARYAPGLRALERDITYPIADGADRFWIDHGPDYHPFFSALGESYFLIALDKKDVVVGAAAGIMRNARYGDELIPTGYACDLKLARAHRGAHVARDMLLFGLWKMLTTPKFRRWRYAYGAAMRGVQGDVMRSVRGLHPGRLFAPAAELRLYFVDPARLAKLVPTGCPPPPSALGLDLSPGVPTVVSTAGTKDLRLVSKRGAPWPLVHLAQGPTEWRDGWGRYLMRSAEDALRYGEGDALACFGIDGRLKDHIDWLAQAGIVSDTVCTIYAWRLPGAPKDPAWVHLATSEI